MIRRHNRWHQACFSGPWFCLSLLAAAEQPTELLYLNLLINDWHTGQTLLVKPQANHFMLETAPLRRLLPALQLSADHWTDSRQLPLQQIRYLVPEQQLYLQLAEQWLPQTRLSQHPASPQIPLNYGQALILNYDLVTESQSSQPQMYGANLELNLNHQQSSFRHQQLALHQFGQTQWLRLDTSYSWQDYEQLHSLQLGDLITAASHSGQAYRFGGLQWRRNFALQPDLITYPLPELSTSLAVPSSTDLFIQGIKTFSAELPPGPFVLESQPLVNGAGLATFVSTDLFGRTRQVEQPFYVADSLLAPGLSDYALSVGWPRLGYGAVQSRYASQPAATVSYRYGQQRDRTLGLSAEASRTVQLAGFDVQQQLGLAGVLGAGLSYSNATQTGRQWRLSYSYQAPNWQLNLRHQQRDTHFADLASAFGSSLLIRQQSQLGVGWQTRYGSAAINLLEQQYDAQPKDRYLNFSYSLASDQQWSGFLSVSYQAQRSAWYVGLSVSYQFDAQLRGAVYANHSDGNRPQQSVSLHRSRPDAHGWNWAAQQSIAATHTSQLYGNYRSTLSDSYLSFSQQDGYSRWSAGSRGSLVTTGEHWFLTEPISQAFAVVDTQGLADLDIYNSNRYVATTNANGKALVPHLLANLPNYISLDPLQLPLDSQVQHYRQAVRPAGVTGVQVDFQINRQPLLLLKIRLADGDYAPPGSRLVFQQDPHISSQVGWDGEVQLSSALAGQNATLLLKDGRSCGLALPAPTASRGFVHLICQAN